MIFNHHLSSEDNDQTNILFVLLSLQEVMRSGEFAVFPLLKRDPHWSGKPSCQSYATGTAGSFSMLPTRTKHWSLAVCSLHWYCLQAWAALGDSNRCEHLALTSGEITLHNMRTAYHGSWPRDFAPAYGARTTPLNRKWWCRCLSMKWQKVVSILL